MTKEELEKEAEKHADGIYHYKINVSDYGEDGIINYRYSDVKEAYQKGAEPREERIAELEKENAELKKFINAPLTKGRTTTRKEMFQSIWELSKQIINAKELILRLYNAGRDVLMCRAEEKAYDNLSNAINDKSIAQFLSEVEK